jgi:hypothetical protein
MVCHFGLWCMVASFGGCTPGISVDPLSGRDLGLVGTWKGTANVQNMALTVVFIADGSFSISGPDWTNYGTFSTDDTQSPKWINVVNQRKESWLGVYELSGTALLWGEQKSNRPSSFTSAPYRYTLTKQ